MAAITLTRTAACSGGGHLTIAMTGSITGTRVFSTDELTNIVNSVTAEQLAFAILRLAKIGRTNAQVNTLLTSGITVTI
jgi:hypothetical protein